MFDIEKYSETCTQYVETSNMSDTIGYLYLIVKSREKKCLEI